MKRKFTMRVDMHFTREELAQLEAIAKERNLELKTLVYIEFKSRFYEMVDSREEEERRNKMLDL